MTELKLATGRKAGNNGGRYLENEYKESSEKYAK